MYGHVDVVRVSGAFFFSPCVHFGGFAEDPFKKNAVYFFVMVCFLLKT